MSDQRKTNKLSDLEYKQYLNNNFNSAFCGAKWGNATIWLGSGRTTSCHHPPAHFVSVEDVKSNYKTLHNTPQKRDDRRKMQNGERPVGCEYCWKIEDANDTLISDRVYKSKTYSDSELREFMMLHPSEDVDLRTLEIAFDRTCQFACSYCNPAFSTTWVSDVANGPYEGLVTDGRGHFTHVHEHDQLFKYGETNPYIDAFFEWWEADLHKTLTQLRVTGGEPLMSGHTWKLLEWFGNNKDNHNVELAINSNLGFDIDLVDRFLNSIDGMDCMLFTSNESILGHAEYIRDGLVWDQWTENVTRLLDSGKLSSVSVMGTINALCLDSLPEFMDQMLVWKSKYGRDAVSFSLNILRFPSFQGVLVLPDHLKQMYRDRLSVWYDEHEHDPLLHENERNQIYRLVKYLAEVKIPHGEGFERISAAQDFKKFYEQYDVRRGKNFRKTFSKELVDWYDSIKVDM